MRLFRYFDTTGAIATLEYKALRVSRLHELNDPFEWRIGISDLLDGAEHIAAAAVEAAMRDLSTRIGVICFSAVPDESVLWSHYADRHQGIVLELEMTEDPQKLIKVTYTDDRPSFPAGMIGDVDRMMPQINRLIRQKSPGWAYEKEFRLYVELSDCDARQGQYFRPLSDGLLKRVIVGWRSTVDLDYIRRALCLAGYSGVSVVRAGIQCGSYRIKC